MSEGREERRRGRFPALLDPASSPAVMEPFWAAAARGRLVAQACTACGTVRLPPSPVCWVCRSFEAGWVELPGTGTVYTFTVVRHPLRPDLADVCPYVTALIELDGTAGAGARLLANLVDCAPEAVEIGIPVEVTFDPAEALPVPRFRPSRSGTEGAV